VNALTRRHGGLLWGEHGKGLCSEFAPERFGSLWPALQEIKAAFDPHAQLNPGKIVTPARAPQAALRSLDAVPLRGDADRRIPGDEWVAHGAAMHCNGNGACFNFDPDDPMCPSWKATRDRRHSPKGRASLMREWLRLQADAGQHADVAGSDDFAHEVHEAMAGCLACKSCSGQCPVRVDVPDLRARFLERYHRRYRRPLKDWLVGALEFALPLAARLPRVYQAALASARFTRWLERHGGLIDLPTLSPQSPATLDFPIATTELLAALPATRRERSVVLVPDAFTRWFDIEVFVALGRLARALGFEVWVAPYGPNGKPLHVHGFLSAFAKVASRQARLLGELGATGVPLVGLDPAMTLSYRQEYRKFLDEALAVDVLLPQEWLARVLPSAPETPNGSSDRYALLGHCTERTTAPAAAALWPEIFARLGLELRTKATGCCGMSGTYGHETAHRDTSRVIFGQSWERMIDANDSSDEESLATGYSCRSQVKRFSGRRLRHPIEVLLGHLERQSDGAPPVGLHRRAS
jgi:Fe-S oxidoreductase